MNILVLSVGTRNKIIQYFKKELQGKGRVIATDMSKLAPALYEADAFYIVPRMTEPGYIEKILEICREEKIQGILSLIDPELSLLAENKDRFVAIGTCVIGSDYEICERSLNKWEMYQWLEEHHYHCAKSYVDKEEFFKDIEKGQVKYPVFVKPVCGSASIAISKVYDRETIELLFQHNEGLMIQEYLEGQEIGADCYIDMISGKLVSVFTKKKLVMRAGETDKAESFIDPKLNELLSLFAEEMGYRGQIDIDVFEKDGTYYISEVNPRFGGGYPHAYECGVNHMKLIVNNLEGKENIKKDPGYDEGIYMMKYSEIKMKKNGGK
ncbi:MULTISPECIES: ATP-grasp domain-containing protein [Oscillospiraceae]|uniref:ATP-grasp domain-containing protein n=1 Tax=Oscillospiraceae TaxID=216572 RepID=UPI0011063515|nr:MULTISPECIES: ATP-grasp domain-containing protein [Oscillospiraceae]